ncbi:hypothetical protein FSP39_009260 [Pinctada imbricata]|uniref:Uncharacterized protein n=1 Tax=Pinctada imbricata TaxID=66713 RepID=A0AA88XZW6_PINIB|nr:hypothetical protein FSP39_009260 [Pinctada imbricata]
MQKHKRRVQHETEKRHSTSKHQTEKTTHKPTRPMGNWCRLWTAICHASSKWCGYPGLRAHNPLTSPITQRSRRTYNCGVKQPPHSYHGMPQITLNGKPHPVDYIPIVLKPGDEVDLECEGSVGKPPVPMAWAVHYMRKDRNYRKIEEEEGIVGNGK